jgi:putative intracellular protease/amidase
VEVAVLLFDGVDAAEALGPAQVLRRLPGTRIRFVAVDPGFKEAHNPPLHLEATHALTQVPYPDWLLVPGGFGCLHLIDDAGLLDWVRAAHGISRWVVAVSTGPVVLAAAGLLKGKRATGHWLTTELLEGAGAVPVTDRIVSEGRISTAIGAAAAIELALGLAVQVVGEERAREIEDELAVDFDSFDTTVPGPAAALVRQWSEEGFDGEPPPRGWRRWLPRREPKRVVIGPGESGRRP